MKQFKNACLLAISILIITSCDGPQGDPGPALTGSVTGFVSLANLSNVKQADLSGVLVTVEGSDKAKTATSDANGKFVIEGLSTGTYNLTYSKDGYQSFKKYSFQFTGGNITTYLPDGVVTLYQVTKTVISDFSTVSGATDRITANVKLTPGAGETVSAGEQKVVKVFVGTTSAVSSSNYILSSTASLKAATTDGVIFYVQAGVLNSGSTYYVTAVVTSSYCTQYLDPETNKIIDPCATTATAAVQVTIP